MLIECPSCHARSELPDGKQGARVRCGACSRVFVARDVRRRGQSRAGPGPGLWIVIGAVVVVGLFLVARSLSGDSSDAQCVVGGRLSSTAFSTTRTGIV